MARTSSTKKKTGKRTTGKSSPTGGIPHKQVFFRNEVITILLFVASLILFLSNFNLIGKAGGMLKDIQFGIFGMFAYIFPIILFITFFFFRKPTYAVKACAILTAYISLISILPIFMSGGLQGFDIIKLYHAGNFGGVVGGVLAYTLISFIGGIGAGIILVAIFILSLVFLFEKSLVQYIGLKSNMAYTQVKEDYSKRKQVQEEIRKEKRLEREVERLRKSNEDRLARLERIERIEREKQSLDEIDLGVVYTKENASFNIENKTSDDILKRFDSLQNMSFEEAGNPKEMDRQVIASAAFAHTENIRKEKLSAFDIGAVDSMANQNEEEPAQLIEQEYKEGAAVTKDDSEYHFTIHGLHPVSDSNFSIPKVYQNEEKATHAELENQDAYTGEVGYTDDTLQDGIDIQTVNKVKHILQSGISIREEEDAWEESARYEEYTDYDTDEEDIKSFEALEGFTDMEEIADFDHDRIRIVEEQDDKLLRTVESREDIYTASGKIIEVDRENLLKKVVQKDNKSALHSNEYGHSMHMEQRTELSVVNTPEKKTLKERKPYIFPPMDLLKKADRQASGMSVDDIKQTSVKLKETLSSFGVEVSINNVSVGPRVTRYEILPAQGVKVSKISALADDMKLALAAADIRIEAPIPGKSAVGIEVPNSTSTTVYFRELIESSEFKNSDAKMGIAIGKDIGGQVIVSDIARMPHLLVAGATGSGKSVFINTLIMSIIYKYSPDEVQMIMVDPKVVELSIYNGIPHLLMPVITEPKKAAGALNWAVAQMTERYKKFTETGSRDLKGYNKKIEAIQARGDMENPPQKLPQILIIMDEIAEIMMAAQKEVEDAIQRLAQLARACGIHLVLATQRPSVNVITGTIKANIPSRVAFSVSSPIDSRTILDYGGAEKLLGMGDMLFATQSMPKPIRVQGAFVSDDEVEKVVDFLVEQGFSPEYDEASMQGIEESIMDNVSPQSMDNASQNDELFVNAGRFIIEKEKASIGNLQRAFKIGFNRAARIMDQLYEAGVVGEEQGTKPRQILMTLEEFDAIYH